MSPRYRMIPLACLDLDELASTTRRPQATTPDCRAWHIRVPLPARTIGMALIPAEAIEIPHIVLVRRISSVYHAAQDGMSSARRCSLCSGVCGRHQRDPAVSRQREAEAGELALIDACGNRRWFRQSRSLRARRYRPLTCPAPARRRPFKVKLLSLSWKPCSFG